MANEQGLSLLDIGPAVEKVPIGDKFLNVFGVSAEGMFALFVRFPEMQKWFKDNKVDAQKLMAETPGAIAAIIAAGCGVPGNKEAEDRAKTFPVETQMDILEAIGRLTFTKGFGPFVKRIVVLTEQAASVNYGRGLGTKSQPTSKPSLPTDTPPVPSGN